MGNSPQRSLLDPRSLDRILIIDGQVLYRECLANSIMARRPDWVAIPVSSLADWQRRAAHQQCPAAILVRIGDGRAVEVRDQLAVPCHSGDLAPLVILSQPEDFIQFTATLPNRVRAFVPSDAGLDVVIEAIDIVRRGGAFLPPGYDSLQDSIFPQPSIASGSDVAFTGREYAVLDALRQGKSNKGIAYALNMSESTVKVHVRNIMKKLRARNRTEVAFLTQGMFGVSRPDVIPSY